MKNNLINLFIEELKSELKEENGIYILNKYDDFRSFEELSEKYNKMYEVLTIKEIYEQMKSRNVVVAKELVKEYNKTEEEILKKFIPTTCLAHSQKELKEKLLKEIEEEKINEFFPSLRNV